MVCKFHSPWQIINDSFIQLHQTWCGMIIDNFYKEKPGINIKHFFIWTCKWQCQSIFWCFRCYFCNTLVCTPTTIKTLMVPREKVLPNDRGHVKLALFTSLVWILMATICCHGFKKASKSSLFSPAIKPANNPWLENVGHCYSTIMHIL